MMTIVPASSPATSKFFNPSCPSSLPLSTRGLAFAPLLVQFSLLCHVKEIAVSSAFLHSRHLHARRRFVPWLTVCSGTSSTADQASAGLLLNLSSNNPFRNRAVSPSLQSPASPFDDPSPRPVSRNPFLDPNTTRSLQNLRTPETDMASTDKKSPTAEDLFVRQFTLTFNLLARVGKLGANTSARRMP